ncbi:hypothetical protein R9C00_11895 [Flammeovirgaceae bacterium SG7u.111]|nr:hypothetical protein [Flammeovirgaceae bacterium SG7u.132]WPO38155.1 hypothetical protein R9C00_11895 [Flammeovirgaceae bacterium SG7u.111]
MQKPRWQGVALLPFKASIGRLTVFDNSVEKKLYGEHCFLLIQRASVGGGLKRPRRYGSSNSNAVTLSEAEGLALQQVCY